MTLELSVAHTWDGEPLAPVATLAVGREGDELVLGVRARHFGDPAPPAPPGSTPRLWQHEVVELFVLGPGERYLEVELGPHGHYLVLQLHGRRRVVQEGLPLRYEARVRDGGWTGTARLPRSYLPPGPHRVNAYTIGGRPRRYYAATPVPGDGPDFHRLERFEVASVP